MHILISALDIELEDENHHPGASGKATGFCDNARNSGKSSYSASLWKFSPRQSFFRAEWCLYAKLYSRGLARHFKASKKCEKNVALVEI